MSSGHQRSGARMGAMRVIGFMGSMSCLSPKRRLQRRNAESKRSSVIPICLPVRSKTKAGNEPAQFGRLDFGMMVRRMLQERPGSVDCHCIENAKVKARKGLGLALTSVRISFWISLRRLAAIFGILFRRGSL
jgi:hypothetical protein